MRRRKTIMPAKTHHTHRELLRVDDNAPFQFTEAYKSLRTNIEFLSSATECKSILITSSVPEEGKSNVAVNLAMTMASAGKKVILVDADLRKGTLSRHLHVSKSRSHSGVTSMLTGNADWKDVLIPMPEPNLILVPAGPNPPNPAEMLASPKMKAFMDMLVKYADCVIIDTPPVSVVTDAAVLSQYVDGVLLVVRPAVTTIQGAQLSKKNLESVNARVLGVVINGYDTKKSSRKDGYYYSYSYDYYSNGPKKSGSGK